MITKIATIFTLNFIFFAYGTTKFEKIQICLQKSILVDGGFTRTLPPIFLFLLILTFFTADFFW